MAGQQLSTSALLIGSAIYDEARTSSDSGGGGRGKPTSQKRGIRPKKSKKGKRDPDPHAWAEGDLDNMGKFMERMHIHVFDRYNYKEQDERNNYSLGKSEVLQKISEFFDQDDKTDFVLYYTGHGAQDGSWLFPVTRSVDTPATQRPAGGGGGGGEGATDVQEHGDGSYMTAVQETQGDAATTATVNVEVHEDGGATPRSRSPSVTPPDDNELENAEETQHREKSPIEARKDTPEKEQSLAPSDTSIVTLLVNDSILTQPPRAKKLNDFITFEDIVEVWDEKRRGRDDRRLMMILDCCHAGRWVQKVNGEQAAWMDCDDNEEAAATPASSPATQEAAAKARKFADRRDICIQAACRPSEKSMVSDDQGGSVFTKAFVSAQTKSLPEKFILMALDHLFVLNIVSIASSPIMDDFTPLSSVRAPFGGVQFLDS